MKRIFSILIAFLFTTSLFMGCSSSQDILSDEEIEELREDYPVYTNGPETADRIQLPVEHYISCSYDIVKVKITADASVFSVSLSGTMPEELEKKQEAMGVSNNAYFMQYEAEVLESALGKLQPGDKITLSISRIMRDCLPKFEIGQEFVVGAAKEDYYDKSPKPTRFLFSRDFLYYTTDSGHILSVFKEEKETTYSGWKVSDFLSMMSKDETIGTYVKPSEEAVK